MEEDGLLCRPLLPCLRVPFTVSLSSGISWAHLKPCVWLHLTSLPVQLHSIVFKLRSLVTMLFHVCCFERISMVCWNCSMKIIKLIPVKMCLCVTSLDFTSSPASFHRVQITIIGFGYDAVSCMLSWKDLYGLLKLFYENYQVDCSKDVLLFLSIFAWQPLIKKKFILFICLNEIKGLCYEWRLYCYTDDVLCFNNGFLFSYWTSEYISWDSGRNKIVLGKILVNQENIV